MADDVVVLDIQKHIEDRLKETQELADRLKDFKSGKRSFQTLHFKDRRRVQSHNPYRIPRRLQKPILRDFEECPSKASRRPRRDRRRPMNLQLYFEKREGLNRRSSDGDGDKMLMGDDSEIPEENEHNLPKRPYWLETHLWSAKRMHMASRFGYKVALRPTQKCSRKQQRYCLRRCAVHDASYMQVYRLPIKPYLTKLVDTTCFPGINNVMIVNNLGPAEVILPEDGAAEVAGTAFTMIIHPSIQSKFEKLIQDVDGHTSVRSCDMVLFELYGPQSLATLRSALMAGDVVVNHSDSLEVKAARRVLSESPNDRNIVYQLNNRKSFVITVNSVPQILGPFHEPKMKMKQVALDSDIGMARYIAEKMCLKKSECLSLPSSLISPSVASAAGDIVKGQKVQGSLTYKLSLRSKKRKDTSKAARQIRANAAASTGVNVNAAASAGTNAGATANAMRVRCMIWFNCISNDLVRIKIMIPRDTVGRTVWNLINRYGAIPLGLDDREKLYATHNVFHFPSHHIYSAVATQLWRERSAVERTKWESQPPGKRVCFDKLDQRVLYPFGLSWLNGDNVDQIAAPSEETLWDRYGPYVIQFARRGWPRTHDLIYSYQESAGEQMKPDQVSNCASPIGFVIDGFHSLLTGQGHGLAWIRKDVNPVAVMTRCRTSGRDYQHVNIHQSPKALFYL